MTHTAINRFRQLAYGNKQAAEANLLPQATDTLDKGAGRAQTARTAGFAVGGGAAVGGLSAILAALLSKKENMLRNAAIAGGAGAAAGALGAGVLARKQEKDYRGPNPTAREYLPQQQMDELQKKKGETVRNLPGKVKNVAKKQLDTAGDALDTLAAWAGYIDQRKNIYRMQNELANPGWEARRQERLERQRAQKELRERRAQGLGPKD